MSLFLCLVSCTEKKETLSKVKELNPIESYSEIVYLNYLDAYNSALQLQEAIHQLLNKPNESNLKKAKQAWLTSREPYGQTEAFRFYEGPIDNEDEKNGRSGPEGQLNAWPLNEAYIDYVKGNPKAGIIQRQEPITKALLLKQNAHDDEANVTTGYHAIEFLLWGQDFDTDGPGSRPVRDFAPKHKRRRQYLKIVTEILVSDLEYLVDEWKPNQDNYRAKFINQNKGDALKDILSALATLSSFELSSERIAVALRSGSQEDEHSCFADNTHRDFVCNIQGIYNVYFGTYKKYRGVGVNALVKSKNKELNKKIEAHLKSTLALSKNLNPPIDKILASAKGSEGRQNLKILSEKLLEQGELFVKAGQALGVKAHIIAE